MMLFTCITHPSSKSIADAQDLMNHLVNRALNVSSLHPTVLNGTTLAKPGNLFFRPASWNAGIQAAWAPGLRAFQPSGFNWIFKKSWAFLVSGHASQQQSRFTSHVGSDDD